MVKRKTKLPRLTAIVEHPSPNFNERKLPVSFLILHYTAMNTTQAALDRLCDPAAQVSSHYLVGEDGTIYRLVQEDKRAWHAGVSYWDGTTDLNSASIGIEIANTGDQPYPKAQMDAVAWLCASILRRCKIPPRQVLGHSDIAPSRKQDPGALFDWQGLAQGKIGVWPTPLQQDYDRCKNWDDTQLKQALLQYGYDPSVDLTTLVTGFQRHFQEDVFQTPAKVGSADSETKARLACLLRRKAAGSRRRK